jgi:hypothetical protein
VHKFAVTVCSDIRTPPGCNLAVRYPAITTAAKPRKSYRAMLCYVMVPLLHTHQRRKQLGVVASCDISQWEARSCH